MLLEHRRSTLSALAALLLALATWGAGPGAAPAGAAESLVGTFRITAGSCSGGGASGSYFRMILPSGGATGPFIDNGDSACADHTYTLLTPGTDGGLITGALQPAPSPGFDGDGNSLAVRLFRPVKFFGVNFSGSTNPTDLQTQATNKAPSITADGGKLSGDLSAFNATWNKQAFNQGSPKPDGSRPGNTVPVTGTYDAATGKYTLSWQSQIVGGPFNNFTGQWHLEGTFVKASAGGGTATTAPASGSGTGTAGTVAGGAATDGGTATTVVGSTGATVPGGVAAPATPTGGKATTAAAKVDDNSYSAPSWLVLLLAALGIAGVVVLLVLDRRTPAGSALEGTSAP